MSFITKTSFCSGAVGKPAPILAKGGFLVSKDFYPESLQNGNSAATPLFTLKQDFKQPLCGKPVQFRCEWE